MLASKLQPKGLLVGLLMAGLLTACGGSSSSSPTPAPSEPPPSQQPPPSDPQDWSSAPDGDTSMQGSVQAPAAMVAVMDESLLEGFFRGLASIMIPAAQAALDGLQTVAGSTVELIEIDDEGNQVGEVIRSAVTSASGTYNLTLPEGLDLSANLVLRVVLPNDEEMRAVAAQQDTDIDPVSEFIVRRLETSGLNLASLATNEIVRIRGQIDGLALNAGDSIAETLSNLEASSANGLMNRAVADLAVEAADGDAVAALAGDYRIGSLELQLGNHITDSFNNQEIWLLVTDDGGLPATLAAAGSNGGVTMTFGEATAVGALQSFPDGSAQQANLLLETELAEGGDQIVARLTDNNRLSIAIPFEEDLLEDLAIRRNATTLPLNVVGGESPYALIGSRNTVERLYGLTADGTIDLDNPSGRREALELLAAVRLATSTPELADSYGLIEIEQGLTNSDCIETFMTQYTLELISDNDYSITGEEYYMDRGTCTELPEPLVLPPSIALTANASGVFELSVDGSVEVSGHTDDGGRLLLVNESITEGDDPVGLAAGRLMLGVPLAASAPNLQGSEWEIFTFGLSYGDHLEELFTLNGSRLSFDDNVALLEPLQEQVISRSSATTVELTTEFQDGPLAMGAVSQNGSAISIDLDDGLLEGFISADGQLGILLEVLNHPGEPSGAALHVLTRSAAAAQAE